MKTILVKENDICRFIKRIWIIQVTDFLGNFLVWEALLKLLLQGDRLVIELFNRCFLVGRVVLCAFLCLVSGVIDEDALYWLLPLVWSYCLILLLEVVAVLVYLHYVLVFAHRWVASSIHLTCLLQRPTSLTFLLLQLDFRFLFKFSEIKHFVLDKLFLIFLRLLIEIWRITLLWAVIN
jgi:hypothetical protein